MSSPTASPAPLTGWHALVFVGMNFEASETAGWHALVFVGMNFEAWAPPHGHEAVAMPPVHNGMAETGWRRKGWLRRQIGIER